MSFPGVGPVGFEFAPQDVVLLLATLVALIAAGITWLSVRAIKRRKAYWRE